MASSIAMPGAPPPKPIPIKDRTSIVFVEKGQLDVLDGAFVLVDVKGVRTHIPVGGLACKRPPYVRPRSVPRTRGDEPEQRETI